MTIQFPQVGERFLDRYRIVEILGAGGMSRVYGAVQDGLDRRVAIKLLAPAGAENLTASQFDNIVARFQREAKLISSFRSSHTVVMYDYGRQDDWLFMILEHVDGQNLHQLVETTGPLPAPRVARIVRQALVSLAEAHHMGILHRDIKPQNIMVYEHLGDPDIVKVLDFGIAKAIGETGKDQRKLTEERTIVGTPSYMSPEQILGNQLTPASDLYSLGLVAYELLFGIVAVEADSAVSTMARHLAHTPIEIPDDRQMDQQFLDILRKMIHKDVAFRYGSASEILADLTDWDGGDPNLTLPRISTPAFNNDTVEGIPPVIQPSQPTEQPPTDKNQPLVVGSALLLTLAILLAVGVVVALVMMMQEQPPDGAAEVAATVEAGPAAEPAPLRAEPTESEPVEVVSADSAPAEPEAQPDDIEPVVEADGEAQPEPEPEADDSDTKAVAVKKAAPKKQAQKKTEPEPEDAVEPPEPLVVVPPQPEPAVATAPEPKPEAEPKPEPEATPKPVVKKTVAKKTTSKSKKDDEDEKKKKKEKKQKAPPLSF